MSKSTFFGFTLLLLTAAGSFADPVAVTNLNRSPTSFPFSPQLRNAVVHAGVTYFRAADASHGLELWRSDGSAAGTYRLTDLCPGPCHGVVAVFGVVQNQVLFGGQESGLGHELWRTDGSLGGEQPVADLCPGDCSPSVRGWTIWADRLWLLTGSNQTAGLWTSDGTRAGTWRAGLLCRDFGICLTGQSSGYAALPGPAPGGRGLLIQRLEGAGTWLYRTDGTPAGTERLHQPQLPRLASALEVFNLPPLGPHSSASEPFFYFLDGKQLWRTDGTATGTHLVRDLTTLAGFDPTQLVDDARQVDGVLHVMFSDSQWLRSDGTSDGTRVLADLPFESQLARIGSRVFALTNRGLWTTEGAPETTRQIAALESDSASVVEMPDRLLVLGYRDGSFLWTTDGTAEGTREITVPAGLDIDANELAPLGHGALFARGSTELWAVDATGTGVARLKTVVSPDGPSLGSEQAGFDSRLIFFAADSSGQSRLYSSDGSTEGTAVLHPEAQSSTSSVAARFARAGRRLYFNTSSRIWTTDGTTAGTAPVPVDERELDWQIPIATLGDRLVFDGIRRSASPRCDTGESEPWISNGSAASTKRIVDLNPFEVPSNSPCELTPLSSLPGPGVTIGNRVLFAADDLVHGRELFVTDGTRRGTVLVKDIHRGTEPNPSVDSPYGPRQPARRGLGSTPRDFVRLGTKVLFTADDGTTGRELWRSDGSARGTGRVVDLEPGTVGSAPRNLTVLGNAVYFFARRGGRELLFRTDGTARGTVVVSELRHGGLQAQPAADLLAAGGRLFFSATTATTGRELWVSAGTEATTRLVADLRPGVRSSAPAHLLAVANGVVFTADDGSTGYEPHFCDGAAIHPLGDIAPGGDGSAPGSYHVVGEKILTGADDGVTGRELWSIPLADLTRP